MTDVTATVQQNDEASKQPSDASQNAQRTSNEASTDAVSVEGETTETGDEQSEKLVPVTEAIRYRKRAQAAEQQIGELNGRLEQLQSQLSDAQQTVSHLERRQHIDAMLSEAEAVDLETARLLTERAVEQMSEPDVQLAVDDLRRTKPFLFRQRAETSSGAMAARESASGAPAEQAAERAMSTGDRRDLLHYLRLRKQKK